MESILITPKNEVALDKLKSLLKEMSDSFVSREIAEEDVFYPVLEEKITDATKRRSEGKSIRIDTSNFDNFLKSIREA